MVRIRFFLVTGAKFKKLPPRIRLDLDNNPPHSFKSWPKGIASSQTANRDDLVHPQRSFHSNTIVHPRTGGLRGCTGDGPGGIHDGMSNTLVAARHHGKKYYAAGPLTIGRIYEF